MAYSEKLAERVRRVLSRRRGIAEKRMFGGLAFLHRGHMCCGVIGRRLVLRVAPEHYEGLLKHKHARPMDFTGRPLRGFLYIQPDGIQRSDQLRRWIGLALGFTGKLPAK